MKKVLICVGAVVLAAACANDPASSSTDPAGSKEYRTGSNIPTRGREGVVTMSPEEMERQRNAATANMGRGKGN